MWVTWRSHRAQFLITSNADHLTWRVHFWDYTCSERECRHMRRAAECAQLLDGGPVGTARCTSTERVSSLFPLQSPPPSSKMRISTPMLQRTQGKEAKRGTPDTGSLPAVPFTCRLRQEDSSMLRVRTGCSRTWGPAGKGQRNLLGGGTVPSRDGTDGLGRQRHLSRLLNCTCKLSLILKSQIYIISHHTPNEFHPDSRAKL